MEKKMDAKILSSYPDVNREKVEKLLQEEVQKSSRKIVVLDDDPTGVQTVHDVSVYTDWTEESIRRGFAEKRNLFYILTNPRGFTKDQTRTAHEEIAAAIAKVSAEMKKEYIIISRSDSTLRGHYPLETVTLKESIEKMQQVSFDGEILCPFFKEGGRFTINNTHYVKYGDDLIPAAQTEFAKDKTFGYRHSNLCAYIEEKTDGTYRAEDVVCISLEELRSLDFEKIVDKLCSVTDFGKIVINAVDDTDMKTAAAAVYRAMEKGKNFMFRTAAAFVKEMGGITTKPLLTKEQMMVKHTGRGGVIVVGSHTQKTTEQLEELKKAEGIVSIEFDSDLVLDDEAFRAETARVTREMEKIIASGRTAVAYTKRKLLVIENDTKESALICSVKISDAVQSLVGNLKIEPGFVIAKGGITSSDVGTKALRVKRATVMGQIRPGIPVWQTGEESRFPFIPYVIFPGNVGDVDTLREAAEVLMG